MFGKYAFSSRLRSILLRSMLPGSLAIGLGLALAVPIPAQQQADEGQQQQQQQQQGAQQQSGDQEDQAAFAKRFWGFLQEADYRENWSRWPGRDEEFSEGKSPHGAFLKVYVNAKGESNVKNPPAETVIVKENYNEQKELVAITPMYRINAEYDPEHNNWYWAKYKPDGSLFEADGKPISGKVSGCIKCHQSAKGEDYVFSNDSGD